MVDDKDRLMLEKAGLGFDYQSVNDIAYRGHLGGTSIITDYANDKLGFWDRTVNKLYTNFLNAKFVEDTKKSRQPVPRYTGNPDWAIWGTWEYHVLTISGFGNLVRPEWAVGAK